MKESRLPHPLPSSVIESSVRKQIIEMYDLPFSKQGEGQPEIQLDMSVEQHPKKILRLFT